MSIFPSLKRLFKHSAIYGIGHIVTRSLGFLLLPLYTNFFPRDEFGVAALMFAYLAVMTILYTYGLDAAFLRYYILKENRDERKTIFSTAFFTVFATSVLFSVILFINAGRISELIFSQNVHALNLDLITLIRCGSFILAFDALAFLPFLVLRAEERSKPFVILKFINVATNILFNVWFIGIQKLGIEGIFYANVASSGITFLIMLPIALKNLVIDYSKLTLKYLLAFGLPYIPSTLSVVLMDTIDRVILEKYLDLEMVGLYNAGAKLGMFMALFVAAFRFAWHPFFLATSKQENAKQVFARVFTFVMLACTFVLLVICFFIDNIVRINIAGITVFGKEYWESTIVVPVIMLAYIFYAAYLNFLIGIYLKKKTIYLPFITMAGMVANVTANFFLIPHIGTMGAAWARPIAYIVMSVALFTMTQRLYPIRYEYSRIAKLVVVTAASFFLGTIPLAHFSIIYKLGILLIYVLGLVVVGFFDETEILKFRQMVSRFVPAGKGSR